MRLDPKFAAEVDACRAQQRLTDRACERIERRAGGGLRRGGRGADGTRDDAPDVNLYGLANLSAANYMASASGGGEMGVSTGFGATLLMQFTSFPTAAISVPLQALDSGATHGYDVQVTSAGVIRMVTIATGGAAITSNGYQLTASDIGKVLCLQFEHTGSFLRVYSARQQWGADVAITGYAVPSTATVLGNYNATLPFTNGSILALSTYRGSPTLTQRQAYFDAVRALGDLPDSFAGVTVTHTWSVKRELAGVSDPSGRKTYGARAFAAANSLSTATPGGVRGSASGFHHVWHGTITSLTGIQVLHHGSNPSGTQGWYLVLETNVLRWYTSDGAGSIASSPTRTLTAADVGRPLVVHGCRDGSGMLTLYLDGVSAGAATGPVASYALVSLPYMVGCTATGTNPAIYASWFGSAGGSGAGAVLSAADVAANFAAIEKAGRILGISGKSDHVWDPTQDIVANSNAMPTTVADRVGTDALTRTGTLEVAVEVAKAPPCPAQLTDRVTAATADALLRNGTPTVVKIDPTIDGRRTLGAQGFSATNRFSTTGQTGLRGSASGFWGHWYGRIDALAGGVQTLIGTSNNGGDGFQLFTSSANSILNFGMRTNVPSNITATSAASTVTAADLGRPQQLQFVYDGTTMYLYFKRVLVASIASPSYAGTTTSMFVGGRGDAAVPQTDCSTFAVQGGDGFIPTLAELQASYDATEAAGRIVAIPGKTQHQWDLSLDILASGVDAVPATVLDRIGTDHLTRVGIDVHTDANAIRGVGPFGLADAFVTAPGGGIAGAATGFHLVFDYWPTKLQTGPESFVTMPRNVTAAGFRVDSDTGAFVRFVLLIGGSGKIGPKYTITSADLNKRMRVVANFTAAGNMELWINGVAAATPVAAGATYVPPTAAQFMAGLYELGIQPLTSGYIEGVAGVNVPASAGNIATYNADLTQAIPTIAGVTQKKWIFEQDIAAVSGALPAKSTERISGGDDLVRIGSPLTLAQRTDRLWSYETSPIEYGVDAFTDADYYGGAQNVFPGAAAGWWYALPFVLESQAVASKTRCIVGCNSPTVSSGWDIRSAVTNTTISAVAADGGGVFRASASFVLAPGDVGKTFLFFVCWDGAKLHAYLKRSESGTGTAMTGYTPADAATSTFKMGRNASSTTLNADGIRVLGGMGGNSIVSFVEVCAAHDAFLAADDLVKIPGKTDYFQSLKQDTIANGGALPTTLVDRINGRNLTKTGSPALVPMYARAPGW